MRYALAMNVDVDDFVAGARSRGARWAATQVARCTTEIAAAVSATAGMARWTDSPPDAWIVTLDGADQSELHHRAVALAHDVRDRIRCRTELTATIGVGSPVGGHERQARARHAATQIVARKLILGGDRVILPDVKAAGESTGPAVRVDATLARCLRRRDRLAAVDVLIRWVDRCAAQPDATPEALRNWLLAVLLGAAESAGVPRHADGSVDWTGMPLVDLFEIAEIHERSYLRLWLENLMSRLIPDTTSGPLERVIAHINQNFGDPGLRLESVAEAVSISPYYISHLFRRQRGETFLKYLTGCRLAQARALLTGTTLPVGQIAGRIGYTSTKRFRIVFKRHLGCPPAEYRRLTS